MAEEKMDLTPESENPGDVEEGSTEEELSKKKIDYEAELKREKERRGIAEKAAADKDFKLRELRRKEKEELGEEDDEEQPLTKKDLEIILQRDRQQTRTELQSEIIAEKARKLAGSDAEAELVIEIHKNRIFPDGMSLDEQLEESYVIANRKTILAKNEELKRALRSKETISSDATGSQKEPPTSPEPKSSGKDLQAIKAAGFVWDNNMGVWKKETKVRIITLSKDLKTQRVIAK